MYLQVSFPQSDQNAGSLKEELRKIVPQLEEMRKRKSDRKNQFLEVLDEIRNISNEIQGTLEYISSKTVDETDLSLRKLEELHRQLHTLQTEKVELFYFHFFCSHIMKIPYSYKNFRIYFLTLCFLVYLIFPFLQSDRMKKVQDHLCTLNSICTVLGMDFNQTVKEVHPSLSDSEGSKNISNETIEKLAAAIQKLREVKLQRMQRVRICSVFSFQSISNLLFFSVNLSYLLCLAATRSCNYDVGALELNGYTNRRATDVSECYP